MEFNNMIRRFATDHPIWTWILARLAICTCIFLIVVLGVLGMAVLIAPIALIADGAGLGAFWWWLLVPVIATIIWGVSSVIVFLFVEVIE